MGENPYESPRESVGAEKKLAKPRKLLRLFEIAALVALCVLVLAATAHRSQIGNLDSYRRSPLIAVEALGLISALVMAPLSILRSCYLAFQRRWKGTVLNVLISGLAIGAIYLALWIDAPTLIHAT
jgi:hypothetical protein